jgi:hypothetical protein
MGRKAKHRANPAPWDWRETKKTLLNRWRFFTKPALKAKKLQLINKVLAWVTR